MWLTRTFGDEFGSSDTQSNYSRLYSWMANQLGHMALGLLLAVICFWSRDAILAFRDRFATAAPGQCEALWTDPMAALWRAPTGGPFAAIDSLLLALVVVIMLATGLWTFFRSLAILRPWRLRKRRLGHDVDYLQLIERHDAEARAAGETPTPGARAGAAAAKVRRRAFQLADWLLVVLLFAIPIIALAVFLFDACVAEALAPHRAAITLTGYLYAPIVVGCFVLILTRTLRHAALGLTMVVAATIIWLELPDLSRPDGGLAGSLALVIVFMTFVFISGLSCDCERNYSPKEAKDCSDDGAEAVGVAGENSSFGVIIATAFAALVGVIGAVTIVWRSEAAAASIPVDGLRNTLVGAIAEAEAMGAGLGPGAWTLAAFLACTLPFVILFLAFWLALRHQSTGASWIGVRRLRDREFFVLFTLTAFVATLLMLQVLASDGLSPDTSAGPGWRTGIAVFLMSIALWWVKEFGADVPLAEIELRDAEKLRIINERGDLSTVPFDDYPPGAGGRRHTRLERLYMRDAKWDSRTDAAFYFTGAWIAAGLLVSDPVLTNEVQNWSWLTGAELHGLLAFTVFFIWRGRIWAARLEALDDAKTPRARSLATLQSEISLYRPEVDQSTKRCDWRRLDVAGKRIRPLNWLYVFATRVGEVADPFRRELASSPDPDIQRQAQQEVAQIEDLRHLVVAGRYGSSRTLVGVAIACDAALAPLQLGRWDLAPWRALTKRPTRFATLAQVARHEKLELAFAPSIAFDPQVAEVLVIDDVTMASGAAAKDLVADAIKAARLYGMATPAGEKNAPPRKCIWILQAETRATRRADDDGADGVLEAMGDAPAAIEEIAPEGAELEAMPSPSDGDAVKMAAVEWIETVLSPALESAREGRGQTRIDPVQLQQQIAIAVVNRMTSADPDNLDNARVRSQLAAAREVDMRRGSLSLWRWTRWMAPRDAADKAVKA